MAPEPLVHHFMCSVTPLPPAQAPLSSPPPRNDSLRGKIYLLRTRLSFPLLALLRKKCGSPPSPVNCSLLAWDIAQESAHLVSCCSLACAPRMLGCWLLLEKQLSEQIQRQKFALEASAEIAMVLLCAWGKKNQHGFGRNSQTKQTLHGKLQFK